MLGDNSLEGTIINTCQPSSNTYARLSMRYEKLIDGVLPQISEGIISTFFRWTVKYKPKKTQENYVLAVDFWNRPIKFSSWEDLLNKAQENEMIKFILDNTDLDEDLLRIAKNNLLVSIPVSFDIRGYEKKVGGEAKFLPPIMMKEQEQRLQKINTRPGKAVKKI